jgi:hypothetical protein
VVVTVVAVVVPTASAPEPFPLVLMVLGETTVMTVVFGVGVVTVVPPGIAVVVDGDVTIGALLVTAGDPTAGTPGTPRVGAVAAGAGCGAVCAAAVQPLDAMAIAIAAMRGIRFRRIFGPYSLERHHGSRSRSR